MKKIFITYANEKFALSLKQILKEANALNIFDRCIGYTPNDLPDYIKANPLMAFKRGGGCWCWKPYIIWKTLQDHPDAIVVYADAGCKLQKAEEWNGWFKEMEIVDTIVFQYRSDFDYGWSNIFPEKDPCTKIVAWTKRSVVEYYDTYIGETRWHSFPSLMSGVVLAKNGSKIIEEWMSVSLFHPDYFCDALGIEKTQQDITFVEHRHDQSILSIIVYLAAKKKMKVRILPETAESRIDSAIVAARRVIKPVSFKTKIVNKIKHLLGEKLYRKIHPKK